MELRVFVKETLKDILGGIHDAQQEISEGQIVPVLNEKGWEGLMLRDNKPYTAGRTRDLAKVKNFFDEEYIVKEIICGPFRIIDKTTKLETTIECMTSVIINNKGTNVKIGSGFSLSERKEYYKNPKNIIGKKITVKYFEETNDLSLRFPIFKGIKFDV